MIMLIVSGLGCQSVDWLETLLSICAAGDDEVSIGAAGDDECADWFETWLSKCRLVGLAGVSVACGAFEGRRVRSKGGRRSEGMLGLEADVVVGAGSVRGFLGRRQC
jgi:hypothetical protein